MICVITKFLEAIPSQISSSRFITSSTQSIRIGLMLKKEKPCFQKVNKFNEEEEKVDVLLRNFCRKALRVIVYYDLIERQEKEKTKK